MDKSKRKVLEGWVEKASTHLQTAKDHLKGGVHYSDAVQACQVCVELSVKAILAFLDVEFSKAHGWDKEKLAKIAEQIQKRKVLDKLAEQFVHIQLPRLIFLANFWDQFYLQAKYGMEAGYLASAQDLLNRDEADIAIKHAEECYNAAFQIRFLSEDKLEAIVR
jgi:HEPN domain-containing protein